jgi:hypothetical protein
MTVKTIDCVECGASVPYGRLSCRACGALLASVSGVGRSSAALAVASVEPKAATPLAPAATAPVSAARVATTPRLVAPAKPARSARSTVAARQVPVAVPAPAAPVAPAVAAPAPLPAPADPAVAAPTVAAPTVAAPALEPEVSVLAPDEPDEVSVLAPDEPIAARPGPTATRAVSVNETKASDGALESWRPAVDPVPMLEPRPYRSHSSPTANMTAAANPPPGHYRPPAAPPAAVASAALGWVKADAPGASDVDTAPPATTDATGPRVVDAARFAEIAGWFVVVGAAMAVLGFLLPWSRVVIGSSGIGGYFDSWGLASPTHVLIVLGLLAVLALGILDTPIPAWLRTGVLGLALGGLLLGLTWPYLIGPLGADVGVLVVAIGGLALVIGGAVASWATRHAGTDPLV